MSNLIGIMGEPGTGKSTSLRSLLPKETFYIDCDLKGLNWRGWKKQYNTEIGNYMKTSFPQMVIKALDAIDTKQKQFKYVVIDTLNNLMVSDEMRRAKEKGYDKWMDMACSIWDIIEKGSRMRDDLTVIILFHTQTDNIDGYDFTRIKTNGRKTEKNNIDSKFNWLLQTKQIDGKYYFLTRNQNSTARTPLGAFNEETIDNDIMNVIKVMEEF